MSKLPKPTLLLFDIGGVILLFDHKITHNYLIKLGIQPENARLFFENEEYKEFARGKINGDDFYEALVLEYLKSYLTYNQVVLAHNEHIYGVNYPVVEFLDAVLGNIQIAFFTNTLDWQNMRERQLIDVRKYSNHVFRSNEIGMLKTDEGAFPYALARLGASPENIIFIDDSIANIDVAKVHGLQTHLFTDAVRLEEVLKAYNF